MLSAQIPSSTAPRAPLALLALGASLLPGLAFAETCPGDYDGLSCTNGTVTTCEHSLYTWTCDLAAGGGSSGGEIIVVRNEDELCGPVATWCAWGTDSTGTDFCCNMLADNDYYIMVYGTALNDDIYLRYDTDYDLNSYFGTSIEVFVLALEGNDVIQGSRSTSAHYAESLSGGEDTDHVFGNAGEDLIWGAEHDDFLYGGDGADTILGDIGDDFISGGDGDDDISGGAGEDLIAGGLGSDYITGDESDDTVCGDGGNDTLFGNDDDDTLWGGMGTDSADGDDDVYGDTCNAETTTECESTPGSMSRPAACPGT